MPFRILKSRLKHPVLFFLGLMGVIFFISPAPELFSCLPSLGCYLGTSDHEESSSESTDFLKKHLFWETLGIGALVLWVVGGFLSIAVLFPGLAVGIVFAFILAIFLAFAIGTAAKVVGPCC